MVTRVPRRPVLATRPLGSFVLPPLPKQPPKLIVPLIDDASPPVAAAGQTVTITGSNFQSQQGAGFVTLTNQGVSWGAPGNEAAFQVESWSDTQITFAMPEPSGPGGEWAVQPNSTAVVMVTNALGLHSTPVDVLVTAAPAISSLNAVQAAAGDTVVISGQYFGAEQGSGYVHLADNGVNWGAPGNAAAFEVLSWSDTQISFRVPTQSNGWKVKPGTVATVTVTNQAGLTSNSENLAIVTAVRWPVSLDSGITNIGKTGDGHMETWVTIDQAGNLTATTETWDTNGWGIFTGFHGAAAIVLFDEDGNKLDEFGAGPYGVEGGQTRFDSVHSTLSDQDRQQVHSVGVVNFYDPQYSAAGSIWDWIAANISSIEAVAKAVAAVV